MRSSGNNTNIPKSPRDSNGRNLPEGIPPIAGIDITQVTLELGNNRKFFLELLDMFLNRFSDASHQVRTDLTHGNMTAAVRLLHTLRGTAGNLGALELTEAAYALEKTITEGLDDPMPQLEHFSTLLAALTTASTPWLHNLEATPLISVAATPLNQYRLETLHRALGCNDLSALDLFTELTPALISIYGLEKTRAMSEAIRMLRFEEVLVLMKVTI